MINIKMLLLLAKEIRYIYILLSTVVKIVYIVIILIESMKKHVILVF
jgi:hypothetical protein